MDFIKIKNFCDNSQKYGENMFKSYIYNGFISRLYKELHQIYKKRRTERKMYKIDDHAIHSWGTLMINNSEEWSTSKF